MARMSKFERWFSKVQFSGKERIRIYRKIIRLLQNGVPLLQALESIWLLSSRDGKKPNLPIARILRMWIEQVKNGKPLDVAIQGWVPETDRTVIGAGDASGRLPEAIENACFLYEGQKKIKTAVIAGVAYPIVLFGMDVAFLFIFGMDVIPKFETALPRDRWTGLAGQMASMADFVQSWMIPLLVVVLSLVAVMFWSMPRWTGKLRVRLEKWPPYSIYKLVEGSGFLLSMAALTAAGVKQTVALRSMMRDARPWYEERISKTLYHVNNGLNLGEALHRTGLRFPDDETVNDLRTYATLNGFDEMLMRLGRENLEETIDRIRQQSTVMRNAGIIVAGVVIAWLFMGIFSIQQQITMAL